MRRFTILAVAALVAVTSAFAQSAPTRQKVQKAAPVKTFEKKKLSEVSLKDVIKADGQKKQQAVRAKVAKDRKASKTVSAPKKKVSKSRQEGAGIIIDQPAGKYYNMVYSNQFILSTLFGTYMGQNSGSLGEVVEGTDGCLYIHNMLTELQTDYGYWVKAEKVEGDTYVIHEQPIWEENYYGQVYTHSIMKLGLTAEGGLTYADNTDIYITWKDGKLDTAEEFNGEDATAVISAIDDSGYWCGACNWDVHMTEQTDGIISELPADAEQMTMVMKYTDDYGELQARKVQAAFASNEVYVQLANGLSWVRGTVQDGKAVFASGQYLGPDYVNNCHAYFIAADFDGNILPQAEFILDMTTHTLTAGEVLVLINSGKEEVYYIECLESPLIYPFEDVARTPLAPEVSTVSPFEADTYYGGGYGYIGFIAPYFDAEENFLDPAKLYYRLYVDDQIFTYQPSEYQDFEEPTTLVPYTFSGNDFSVSGTSHYIYTYWDAAKNIGLQQVYTGGGETHESEIAWYEVESGIADGTEGFITRVEDGAPNKALNDGEIALNLGFAESVESAYGTSSVNAEHYDVAYHLNDPALVGAQIVALNVPFYDVEELSNTQVWLSKSLNLNGGKFTADVVTKSFEAGKGFIQVVLDQPYTITEEGVYVGYSFDQAANVMATPVVSTGYTSDGGFIIHSSNVYRYGWFNMYGKWGDLALETVLKGGPIKANATSLEDIQHVYAQAGEERWVKVDVTNFGYKGTENIDFTYDVAGKTGTIHYDLDPSLEAAYGAYHTFKLPLPAIDQKGEYPLTIKVAKVNGEENLAADPDANTIASVLTVLPKKLPVLEEYTGTWCGYCPRGFVALEKMSKLYPEEFIALSYHNEDPMEFTTEFPSDVAGFPDAWLDRVHQTDAYCGDGEYYQWGIEQTWLERCEEFGVADINVTAEWADATQDQINVKSAITFPQEVKDNPYQIEYALVADGLTGTTQDWAQSNYYTNEMDWGMDMIQFILGSSSVKNLVFNDVIVDRKEVADALPAYIPEDGLFGNDFQLSAEQAVNTSYEPIIQNKDKVRVVAMVVNTKTGEIVNAAKCNVLPAGTGISNTATSRMVESVSYYDLSGRKVLVPNGGVYIKSVRYKDGSSTNQKVLVK